MTGKDVLLSAAAGPLSDDAWRDDVRFFHGDWPGKLRPGGGFVLALLAAANYDQRRHWNKAYEAAYHDAHGALDAYCESAVPIAPETELAPRTSWQRGREESAIRIWASDKSEEDRRELLYIIAEQMP